MTKIFISYRRADSADVCGRIYDGLVSHFGKENVFKDVDDIPAGADFRQYIEGVLQESTVLLAVIGRFWAAGDRLSMPEDMVRVEIETARSRGIRVIPVLVMGARMPPEHWLPESLIFLTFRNAMQVRPDPDFHIDMTRLIKAIAPQGDERTSASVQTPLFSPLRASAGGGWDVVIKDSGEKIHVLGAVELTFDITNPNELDMRLGDLYVDVLEYKEAEFTSYIPYSGIGLTRRYDCIIRGSIAAYRCEPASNEYDYIKLSRGELERFFIKVYSDTPGIFKLRVRVVYVVGERQDEAVVGVVPEWIGYRYTKEEIENRR